MSELSFEAILKQATAGIEAQLEEDFRTRYQALPEGTFPAASLVQWMEAARKADVAAVPMEVVANLTIDHLLRFDCAQTEEGQATLAKLEAINASVDSTSMLRWDCCASMGIKMAMSDGTPLEIYDRHLFPDDPRAFDILFQFPADEIAVIKRPWVEAQVIDNWPVEFRVFVEDGQVVAVANYYFQRDLPDTPAIRQAAAMAVTQAQAIVAAVQSAGQVPAMPRQPEPERFAATLDFLVTPSQEVLFLEAGPGHFFGAHPCAFLQADGRGVDPLEGLRLGQGQVSITMAELPAQPDLTFHNDF